MSSKPGADEQVAAIEQKMLSLWYVLISNHHDANIGMTYYLYADGQKDIMDQAALLAKCHPGATAMEIRPVRNGVRIGRLVLPVSISQEEYERARVDVAIEPTDIWSIGA